MFDLQTSSRYYQSRVRAKACARPGGKIAMNGKKAQNESRKAAAESTGSGTRTDRADSPLILAVETSGRMGSVALAAGPQLLLQQEFTGPMRHSAELFPAICRLLERSGNKANNIEQVYVSIGPGSFTGLRIAATLAKTMHLAGGTKIVAVDTLDVIAANITTCGRSRQAGVGDIKSIAVILDAKRGQFFVAAYEKHKGRWQKSLDDCLMTAEQFLHSFAGRDKPVRLLGEGLVYYRASFAGRGIYILDEEYWLPRAEMVHLLGWAGAQRGEFAEPVSLAPKYLRRPDVKVKKR